MKRILILSALAGFGLAPSAMAQTAASFGTNWVAQGEHGGYYQAVEDGSYKECGLDVTIVPGGPQVNNRAMMLAGKIDFNMAGNLLSTFNAAAEGVPVVAGPHGVRSGGADAEAGGRVLERGDDGVRGTESQ